MSQSDKELLKRIPGIGDVKAQRLVNKFSSDARGTIRALTTASKTEIASVQGFNLDSATKLFNDMQRFDIEHLSGQKDPRERKSKVFGEFSSEMTDNMPGTDADPDDTGLTTVDESDFTRTERKRAQKFHDSRSEISQKTDEALDAKIAEDFDQWRSDKDEFDIPGIDGYFD